MVVKEKKEIIKEKTKRNCKNKSELGWERIKLCIQL